MLGHIQESKGVFQIGHDPYYWWQKFQDFANHLYIIINYVFFFLRYFLTPSIIYARVKPEGILKGEKRET